MDQPRFDEQQAGALLGKHTLIALTYYEHTGAVIERVQLHGDIVEVDEEQVTVSLGESGEKCTVPPDLSAFVEAPPGEYRFRATGEVVVNPDLMAEWNIYAPPPEESA